MRSLCCYFIILLLFACSGSTARTEEEIARLETELTRQPSEEVLVQLLDLYKEMAGKTTGAEHMDYLWKAGETARAARDFPTAETIFLELYSQDTDPDLAAKALFLHAFMCDEDLKQFDRAKTLYEQFIKKFPDSDFTDDAQFLLENLGKTDEEMLELLNRSDGENAGDM